ncbi:MAG: redoxin domain-containing protein, partial [Puniceicoccales bacterium]|nr:redoxin domain-containing protein [Puniceicoccales bacterium]
MSVLVGEAAPLFSARAVRGSEIIENFSLTSFLGKRYVMLFFYPKDFTFVCPTELHAFQEKLPEFERRNVQVVGCSTDSEFCHLAWLETPRERGGIAGVTYPIIADINKIIARDYGIL